MPEATSYSLLEPEKHSAVERDRLPRVARYRTGHNDGTEGETLHVLYWGGAIVQSMRDTEWLTQRGPLPTDPTQGETDVAVAAIAQADQQARQDAAQLRQQLLNLAQSAVGVRVDALTAVQVRALFALILRQEGALNNDLTIRPLADWAR